MPLTRDLMIYSATFVALLILATVSLFLGDLAPVWLGVAISMVIAAIKALLVLWNFMNMSHQPFRTHLAMGVSFLLVLLLMALTAADVMTRTRMQQHSWPTPGQTFYTE